MHFKWGCGIAASLKLTMYYCDPTFCLSDVSPTNSQTQNLAFQAQQKELRAINYLSIRVFFSKKVPSISVVVDHQALS